MPTTESMGSSVSYLMAPKDISGDTHFRWISIRKFLYCAFVHSSHSMHFDLFSGAVYEDLTIFNFTVTAVTIGMPYMCMDFFIKQYTRRLDFNEYLSPLLKGISISVLIQTTLWNIMCVRDAGDAVRYFFTSLTGNEGWANCEKFNYTLCWAPRELLQRCDEKDRLPIQSTSAHLNYVKQFYHHDRSIITTRFFVTAVVWILNFFLSSVSDTSIIKFYKIIFLCKTISTVFTLSFLMISSDEMVAALMQIMKINVRISFRDAIGEVSVIFGVGMIGVYDVGSVSPFNMIDNTVIIFTVSYILLAFLRSIFVKIMWLVLAHCVVIDFDSMTSHYLQFALLPLSTGLLYGQKLYNIYIYGSASLTIVAYLTLFTFTMAKIIRTQYRAVKNVYIVGIFCFLGFCVSVPLLLANSGNSICNGLLRGFYPSIMYLGGVRMMIIMWIYGVNKFSTDINFWLGYRPTRFWTFLWAVVPFILVILCVERVINVLNVAPDSVQSVLAFLWFLLAVLISIGFQVKTLAHYILRNNLLGAFRASKKYGPPDIEDRRLRRNYDSTIYHRKCAHDCMILDEGIDCNHLPLMNPERGISSSSSSNPQSLTHLFEAEPVERASSVEMNLRANLH